MSRSGDASRGYDSFTCEFLPTEEDLPIKPQDVVLDVGSGGKPHPRANVLCERFLHSTRDRRRLVFDSQAKDVVVGDVQDLPFKDKSFDYVICSHLLEHLAKPAQAVRELQRVARAGYIETPSVLLEVLTDNPGHESFVYVEGNTLIIQRKRQRTHPIAVKPYIRRLWRRRAWRGLLSNDEFFVRYFWRDHVDLRVIGGEESYQGCSHTSDTRAGEIHRAEDLPHRFLRRTVLPAISAVAYRDRAQYDLRSMLCCPKCRADLEMTSGSIRCSACASVYYYEAARIPRLLASE